MPNILALFALFSIGSAAAIGCTKDAGYCTTAENVIGYCTSSTSTCNIDTIELCKNKSADAVCGEDLFQGKCVDEKCLFNKKIKVDYTLDVTTGKTAAFKSLLAQEQFKVDLAKEFNRNISTVYPACDATPPALPSNATSVDCPTPRKFFGTKCDLVCSSGFRLKKAHGTACGAGGSWDVNNGECAKSCPLTLPATIVGAGGAAITGTLVTGSLDTIEFVVPSKSMTLSCNIFGGKKECDLKCTGSNSSHKSTGTKLKCLVGTSGAWTGDVGVCSASTENVSGTLAVVLNGMDNEAALTSSSSSQTKTDFEKDFKLKLSLVIPGISAENVTIVAIRQVPASARRLNAGDAGERSVLVDYTIVGPPEDAAELVPPRVLRGIP